MAEKFEKGKVYIFNKDKYKEYIGMLGDDTEFYDKLDYGNLVIVSEEYGYLKVSFKDGKTATLYVWPEFCDEVVDLNKAKERRLS